ncbi:MAG TPA: S-layer homology domain-containing protein, partial [Acetivibrio sp.]|nr:S-layer homology domain-containing protein [Acetivibrio sp.]
MEKRKRIISYLLIICMIISSLSCVAAGTEVQTDSNQNISVVSSNNSQTFPDIKDHWCKEYIEKFLSKKWVVGYDDGLFRPDRFVTRAEFTAMVVNIFKKVESVNECNFTDVEKSDWFYNAVAYAAAEGLIQGYENG